MDEQKKPRAWVYARIPGDYDGTMNSFKVCSMQALRDGCDIVGGSTDEHGGWLLRPGYPKGVAAAVVIFRGRRTVPMAQYEQACHFAVMTAKRPLVRGKAP